MDFSPPTPPGAPSGDFEQWELETANVVVRAHVAASGRFAHLNHEDLVQECLVHWWQKRGQYREERGATRRTFMNRVLSNKLRDLRRAERARKRPRTRSLDDPVEPGSLLTLADTIAASPESDPHHVRELTELREGLDRARRRLTPRQRELVDGLTAGQSMSALSRGLRVSRDTLYEERKRIRDVYRAEGLEDYFS